MAGRPRIYATAEELELEVENYFKIAGNKKTITGLILYLGFESRQSFYDYEKSGEFSYAIKRAHLMIEESYEEKLTGQNVTGPIFALKNLGWKDKTEQDIKYPDGVALNFNTVPSVKPLYETKGDTE